MKTSEILKEKMQHRILALLVFCPLLAWLMCIDTFGQMPVVNMPQPAALPNSSIGSNKPNTTITTPAPYNASNQQQLDLYEQDKRYVQLHDSALYKTMYGNETSSISYDLPSAADFPGANCYRDARGVLDNMVKGKSKLNLKKAVFSVENAYFNNHLPYEEFDKQIKQSARLIRLKMQQKNMNPNDNFAKNMLIFSFMTDTFTVKDPSIEKTIVHYPLKYDFDDYRGDNDWSKMFVCKLMRDNSGQCHSLPLMYLILAEELGAKAYLSFAPSHSYIKIKNKKGDWANLELTSGAIISDAGYMDCGYIKSEAIKNRIYLDTIGKERTIASMYFDLANGYIKKYGYDEFVIQCVDTSLRYFPNDIFALQLKADWHTANLMYVRKQKGNMPVEEFKKDPKANALLTKASKIYQFIDSIGYEQMPEEKYQRWLQMVEEAKRKAANQTKYLQQYTR